MAKAKTKSITRSVKDLAKLPAVVNADAIETADRALPIYKNVPAGCLGHLIENAQTEPHLRRGEIAIIDATDKTPVAGELFLIRFDHPLYDEGVLKIVQVIRKMTGLLGSKTQPFWVAPYAEDQYVPGHGMMRMMDGPYNEKHLSGKLVGRVVGVLQLANTKRLEAQ